MRNQTNPDGYLDLVKRSGKPLQELSWSSIGNILTAIQIQEARELLIGTVDDQSRGRVETALPDAQVFISGLERLNGSSIEQSDAITISRLLVIDQNTILVSSMQENPAGEANTEKAVFERGFDNGIVVIARRLMATGVPAADANTAKE
ncbi:hypothetical protein [Haladaptatus halobius]|uniref:hypothetical protein n=1 Tax=Haladaptatus halobius TaxID=2884875 RepID=UPI001D0AB89B|nr:hypothetical protein [Haladaptatus halobius]